MPKYDTISVREKSVFLMSALRKGKWWYSACGHGQETRGTALEPAW